jgi:hypothetical protein
MGKEMGMVYGGEREKGRREHSLWVGARGVPVGHDDVVMVITSKNSLYGTPQN